jgi:hypothetical protein
MSPKKRRLMESRKYYRGSPRSRTAARTQTIKIEFQGANPDLDVEALDELPGKSNYFVGNDSALWRTGIPTFQRVRYHEIYPGIDLVFYGNRKKLEFDFCLSAYADPGRIDLQINGDDKAVLSKDGSLTIGLKTLAVLLPPSAYQRQGDLRVSVKSRFVARPNGDFGFVAEKYDASIPLVIDPTLAYSTYVGGNGSDEAFGIAVDSTGSAYLVGETTSTNFPLQNSYSSTPNSSGIAFISKLSPDGSSLLYSTYIGGTSGEVGNGIALDNSGGVYITGYTLSSDFPIVNGFQTSTGTTDANAFVAKIDTTRSGSASLIYSTYIGGGGNSTNPIGDVGYGIAVDAAGLVYVTGQTTSDNSVSPFPTTSSAYQTTLASTAGNAFVTVLDPAQAGSSSLIYSTYLGGGSTGTGDFGLAIAVDVAGNAFVTGQTTSSAPTFPTTATAFQTAPGNSYGSAFLAEIATTGSGSNSLLYSTYLGGSGNSTDATGDVGFAVALDPTMDAYVSGNASSADFPVTAGAYQTTNPANRSFVAKLDPSQSGSASLIYSTFLGGTDGDEARGLAVDSSGEAFVGGATASSDFPTTTGAYQASLSSPISDAFVSELNSTGTTLLYSTYFGGSCSGGDLGNSIAIDSLANPYLAGATCSSDLPVYPTGAYQTSLAGSENAFVAKIALVSSPGVFGSVSPTPNSYGWNNSAVMVSFNCVPGGSPITSCTAPQTLSVEGANQSVTGTATDSASDSASATETVNIDFTPPSLSISTPSNGSSIAAPYVSVSGSVSDSLSGVAGVTCNGIAATVSGSTYSCTVLVFAASDLITVNAADSAGNQASTSISISVAMAAPTSLQISPTSATLGTGESRKFSASDQTGIRRPDVSWTVSDSTIASLSTDGSGTLTGVAAGTVTLSASIGSVSASTTVTVTSASSITDGTLLWSAPAISGFTTQSMVQAVRTANGPDLYSIETDSSGDVIVRGFKSNGTQLFQTPIPALNGTNPAGAAANDGGVILNGGGGGSGPSPVVDVSGQGSINWTYYSAGYLAPITAVGQNNDIYEIESASDSSVAYLDVIDGNTGSLTNQVALPTSSYWIYNSDCFADQNSGGSFAGNYSPPFVGDDGSVAVEVESYSYAENYFPCNEGGPFLTFSENLSLMQLATSGSVTYQTLNSYSGSSAAYSFPGDVIPDGNGGWLASWGKSTRYDTVNGGFFASVSDVTSSGVNELDLASVHITSYSPTSLATGDQNFAFITDGGVISSLTRYPLSQSWTYTSSTGVAIKNSTPNGGVLIDDFSSGTVQLDSSGAASSAVSSLVGIVPIDISHWAGISSGVLADYRYSDGSGGLSSELPRSPAPSNSGYPNGQRRSSPCFTSTINCVIVPAADVTTPGSGLTTTLRKIDYALYFLDFSGGGRALTPQYTSNHSEEFNVELRESFRNPPNTLTSSDATICVPSCPPDGFNYLEDKLDNNQSASGSILSVYQSFYVNRQQVQVFWPGPGATQWYGAPAPAQLGAEPPNPSQQATIPFNATGVVEQLQVDTKNPATCQKAVPGTDHSFSGGCSPSPPSSH